MAEPRTVSAEDLQRWPLPAPGEDKEARGRLLVVGGSRSTPGAVLLAAEAALRVGAGKLRIATAASVARHVAVLVPEAKVRDLPEAADGSISSDAGDAIVEQAEGCDAVLLGPGFTDPGGCLPLLEAVVPRLGTTVVLDALATAYVTADPERLRRLGGRVVLTVNPTELARTLHRDPGEVTSDPVPAAVELSRRTGATVLHGGQGKVVVCDGSCWRVDGGGVGLGVSGSGDVQSGLVTGLLARGASPAQAAVWAGYLHAAAGDRLAGRVGTVGFLARELPAEVPRLLEELSAVEALP
jgi:ADP-dependent NAD(P)H-hydrate dehydratase